MAASVSSFGENRNRLQCGFDPDTYARYYAKQNGITVVEARYVLRTKYGASTAISSGVGQKSEINTSEASKKSYDSELQMQTWIKSPQKLGQQLAGIVAFLDSESNADEGNKSLTDKELYM